MKKEDKATVIAQIAETIKSYSGFYLVETAGLDAEKTSAFRRACFGADVKLMVVKNTLLHKALESLEGDYSELYPALKGSTSLMCTNVGNAPAKLLKDFVKIHSPLSRPLTWKRPFTWAQTSSMHLLLSRARTNLSPMLWLCSSRQPRTLSALLLPAAASSMVSSRHFPRRKLKLSSLNQQKKTTNKTILKWQI